jgi:hypothetical protein
MFAIISFVATGCITYVLCALALIAVNELLGPGLKLCTGPLFATLICAFFGGMIAGFPAVAGAVCGFAMVVWALVAAFPKRQR